MEKTLENPLNCKEIQPVHLKGDQSWVLIGRTDAEAETQILWPPRAKSWLIRKDPDAGRDWGQEEKETMEDEMTGWPHRLDAHEFGWTPGVGDGWRGLACCDSWVAKSRTWLSDWTELKNTWNRKVSENMWSDGRHSPGLPAHWGPSLPAPISFILKNWQVIQSDPPHHRIHS